MALAFRNLTSDPADPVSTWPTEAVQAALERGDLDDWHRLAVAIDREPWGRTARGVREVLSHSRPFGVADVMDDIVDRARARAEQRERDEVAAEVRAAIARAGVTTAEFATWIGTSASRLSTYANGRVVPAATMMVRIRRVAPAG